MTDEQKREVVDERIAQKRPWHRVPHQIAENQTYIVTGTCFEHRANIEGTLRRTRFAEILQEKVESQGAKIFAWCVLPNHYHLLVQGDLPQIRHSIGRLHGSISHAWNREENCVGRQIWYGCTDRAIRSERHFYVSMNYIHNNAVKHGYAARALLWPHSSLHFYHGIWGSEKLREMWIQYPVRDYGETWD